MLVPLERKAERKSSFELVTSIGGMGLSNAMPAVCSAIGSLKFSDLARVSLLETKGPANGANVYFRFGLGARATKIGRSVPAPESRVRSEPAQRSNDLDLRDAIVLVSCVKT